VKTGRSEPVQAGIYCRISLAAMGDTTKVDDQERICRELADRLGWHVADVYQDHAKSAWQPSRKRKAWDRMVADIEAGRINGIVVYHGDRLLRTHEDLLTLIRLARTRGVHLASPAGTRDLGNYDDQFILEIEASMAKRESANTSRRRKAQYDRWRREGRVRPGGRGGRPFGFTTDGVTPVPDEMAAVREAAARLLAGDGTLQICRDLNARGVLTTAGAPMTPQTLRKMLARPRYAGLMPDGVSKAAWEPALDRDTWEAVCAVLDMKRSQHPYATNARRWLLSGIAECGACGSLLQMRQSQGRSGKPPSIGYGCVQPGCRKVYRSAELLDAYASRRTVNRLASPANPAPQGLAATGLATQYAALEEQRRETEEAVRDWQATPGRVDLLMARLDSIDTRLAELRQLAAGDARARLQDSHAGLTHEEFAALPLATRRALVSACYRVIVLPASKRGPGFRTEDVQMVPRA
jgi:DNA invertase Pin-like site-specific DNA recombinase